MLKILIILIALFVAQLPARSAEFKFVPAQILKVNYNGFVVDGLTHVQRRSRFSLKRSWFYRVEGSEDLMVVPKKIKKAKDLRSYEEQHPRWVKIQKGCEHWVPVGGAVVMVTQGYWMIKNSNLKVVN